MDKITFSLFQNNQNNSFTLQNLPDLQGKVAIITGKVF